MTAKEIYKLIKEWEMNAGESFYDYFSHDTINDYIWAGYLIGKGYAEHGNIIIGEKIKSKYCLDQDLLYCIYPEYFGAEDNEWNEKNSNKNLMIMAKFLCDVGIYQEAFKEFLKRHE